MPPVPVRLPEAFSPRMLRFSSDPHGRGRSGLAVAVLAVVLACAAAACSSGEPGGTTASGPDRSQTVEFTDVTEESGLGSFRHRTGSSAGRKWMPESLGSGIAFIDYDGDGWSDVLLAGGGSWPRLGQEPTQAVHLYRNQGDGTFREVSAEAGLEGITAYGFGLSVADYDNDGDSDFFLSTLGRNLLFRNEDGRFEEVGAEAGLSEETAWSTAAIFFDADHDGRVDLYVGNYVDWSPENDRFCSVDGENKSYCTPDVYDGVSGRFYRNLGDGTFEDRTSEAGFSGAPGKTLGAAELDFNDDGLTDLVVANDLEPNLLYRNEGDGTFAEEAITRGVAYAPTGVARAGMGVDTGVIDTTGRVSIAIGNFAQEMVALYRYRPDGLFADRSAASNLGRSTLLTLTFGLFFFDADLDADLDLLLANGHVQEHVDRLDNGISYRQQAQLFLNDGRGQFEDVTDTTGVFGRPLVARGAAAADVDHDGDLDVLLTENEGPVHLWRNDAEGGPFLRVSLSGRSSNRDGLGARIEAVAGENRQTRRVHAGSSYLSQSELPVTFGLPTGTPRIDTLRVRWPGGSVDRFTDVPTDQAVRITEEGELASLWSVR